MVKCKHSRCKEEAVGEAYFEEKGEWYGYCKEHLAIAASLHLKTRLFWPTGYKPPNNLEVGSNV